MNLNFIKTFVESDFILSENSLNLNNRIQSRKASVTVKDPFSLNKELKQFLRCLKLLDKKTLGLLYIWVENKYLATLFSRVLNQNSSFAEVKISEEFLPNISKKYTTKLLLSIGKTSGGENALVRKALESRILLLVRINNEIKKKITGLYFIENNLDNLKRACFIMILIRHSLNIKKLDA